LRRPLEPRELAFVGVQHALAVHVADQHVAHVGGGSVLDMEHADLAATLYQRDHGVLGHWSLAPDVATVAALL
jgi:hypothetical protein